MIYVNPVCMFPGEESLEEMFMNAREMSAYEDQREEGNGYDV